MPEYDHNHVMTLAEYLSVLDPFLAFVTVVMVVGMVCAVHAVVDLFFRSIDKKGP